MITSLNSFQWFSVPLLSEALGVLTAYISLTREEKRKPVELGCFEHAIPSFPMRFSKKGDRKPLEIKHSMSDFQLTRLNGQFCPIR